MGKKRICLVPYDGVEIYAVEKWLTAQAEKGWQLKAFRGSFAVFERSAPRPTRYCLDVLDVEKYAAEQELREYAAAQGWEYVSDFAWHSYGVYRSDDPGAVAFHSDPAVLRAAMRGRILRMAAGLVALALVIAHLVMRPNGLIAVLRGSAGSAVYLGDGLFTLVSTVLLLLFWVVLATLCLGSLRRARRDLRQGFAGARPPAAVLTACRLLLTFCALAAAALLLVGRQYQYGAEPFMPVPAQSGLGVPLWQTIDAEEYEAAQAGRPDEPAMDDFFFAHRSPFSEEIRSVRQAGDYRARGEGSAVMDTFYDADLCVMKSVRYAEKAFDLLAREDGCAPLTPSDGFEAAAWGRAGDTQALVLRKDNIVIWALYNGGADLREQIRVFADTLQQGENA